MPKKQNREKKKEGLRAAPLFLIALFFQNLSERKDRIADTFRAGTQNFAGSNAFQVLADGSTAFTLEILYKLFGNTGRAFAICENACHHDSANPNFLKEKLGKIGPMLWGFANGLDTGAVAKYEGREVQAPIKSIGNSWTTPRDLKTDQDVLIVLYLLSESVAARLRENHFRCRGVEVSLRDSSLFSFERQVKLSQPTMQEKDIAEAAYQLYKKNYRWSEHLRSVGVRAIDLRPDTEPNQISFEYSAEKQEETERLESAIDGIRNRFGYYSVQRAVMYKDRFLSHCDAKGDHTIHPHGYLQGSV